MSREGWVDANQGRYVCACGCGQAIKLRPEHHSEGIPRYVHGHNGRGRRKPLPPTRPCKCGCGQTAGPGKRFVSGHNARSPRTEAWKAAARLSKLGELNPQFGKTGPAAPRYKERIITGEGYVLLHAPDHPFAQPAKGLMMEHRLVMEAHLRATDPGSRFLVEVDGQRYLRPEIEVHHKDEVKANNVVGNLECLTTVEHAALHAAAKRTG